ncbi:UNVERIFIED_CONTAM: putative B3 domain-containing protein [Sesamum radiatum]|uniref:B3 domain-containing protein n=2 Tax=Sesamum TaxID=4181 RepID=A0AAW2UNB3_SESRA
MIKATEKMPQILRFSSLQNLSLPLTRPPSQCQRMKQGSQLILVSSTSPATKEACSSQPQIFSPAPRGVAVVVPRPRSGAHILPHVMGNGPVWDEGQGVEVAVWDMDTGSEHVLVLKKWKTGSFVLMKNWMSDFVRRRGLEKNDEIGLRWDDGNSRLEFTVLNKN